MNIRCAEKLPSPRKLIDIVDFGINNPDLSTSAFGELLEQINHTDKFHTLFAFDGYNDWFRPSEYLSFRYENDKHLKGTIPPKDFAMVRLLMKFDGHLIRNGYKLLATTQYRQFNHICTPEMINFPVGYHAKVENLALNDFRSMLVYKNITDWMPDHMKEWEVESWYMETQGNFDAFHKSFMRYQRLHF
jgi:small subunit ribosomal protein S29